MSLKKLNAFNLVTYNLKGEILLFISNFLELGLLDLSNNSLNGSIPKEISNLKKLYYLRLIENFIKIGSIPLELGDLTLLQDLDASGSNIPQENGNLKKISYLQL